VCFDASDKLTAAKREKESALSPNVFLGLASYFTFSSARTRSFLAPISSQWNVLWFILRDLGDHPCRVK
jgi:hypothetical protein